MCQTYVSNPKPTKTCFNSKRPQKVMIKLEQVPKQYFKQVPQTIQTSSRKVPKSSKLKEGARY